MARADLLLGLVQAATKGDTSLFRRTVEALISEERGKQHHVLADRLEEALRSNGSIELSPPVAEAREASLIELSPRTTLDDLILIPRNRDAVDTLVEEHHRSDLLRSHNVEPRNRVLLAGPPGNGKTSLAEAIADRLVTPFLVVHYENLIGSYLGETALRLRRLFDHVRTRRAVLFFDEFDTLAKERGDIHETGEIKRVVSSLLLQIDALPSYVVVVVATNHPELLDRAVWRRFQLRLELSPPSPSQVMEWFEKFQSRTHLDFGYSLRTLAQKFGGASYSDLEQFALNVLRQAILKGRERSLRKIVGDELNRWRAQFTALT